MVLTATAGARFSAYGAPAKDPNGPRMVILPDGHGLHHYEELALRFAETGINAVAIDYFGLTAGLEVTDEMAMDTGAAMARLRFPAGGGCSDIFAVGFCRKGSNSWNPGAAGHGLAGCIRFYGQPQRTEPFSERIQSDLPIAGADFTPAEAHSKFQQELARAGGAHEAHNCEGAPHNFLDRTFEPHRQPCADAWQRMRDFTARPRSHPAQPV